jgi:hypothetical protein
MRQTWSLLGALVIVLMLVAPAHAVDWSAYIDHSAPAKAQTAPAPEKASRAKVSKRGNKKIAKGKGKAKGKAKVKARAKGKKARR